MDFRRWIAGELIAGLVCAAAVSLTRWLIDRYQRTRGTWETECGTCGQTFSFVGYANADTATKLHAEYYCDEDDTC